MRIWIDAGHGGTDSGAVSGGVKEKEITLAICQKLTKQLTAQGFTVAESRGQDTYLSVAERAQKANAWGADLFVSVHCNAAQNTAAAGTEVLCYQKGTESSRLAEDILHFLVTELHLKDRGVKERKDLAVLNSTKMPAILVETAFLTKEGDRKKLNQEQDAFALAMKEGILAYLGVDEEELSQAEMRYETLTQVPAWGQPTVEKMLAKQVFADPAHLDLSRDMVRIFVLLDRYGLLG